eukprot:scaffold2870_cov190-Alexandrium_tamarense.AAC.4
MDDVHVDLEFESDSTISMVWRLKQCESSVEIGKTPTLFPPMLSIAALPNATLLPRSVPA